MKNNPLITNKQGEKNLSLNLKYISVSKNIKKLSKQTLFSICIKSSLADILYKQANKIQSCKPYVKANPLPHQKYTTAHIILHEVYNIAMETLPSRNIVNIYKSATCTKNNFYGALHKIKKNKWGIKMDELSTTGLFTCHFLPLCRK